MQRLRRYAASFLQPFPRSRAIAAVVGMGLALQPWDSLQGVLLVVVFLIFHANLIWALVSWGLGMLVFYLSGDIAGALGEGLLTDPGLRVGWAYLFHSPLIPFTRFNETRVLGCGIILPVVAAVWTYVSVELGDRMLNSLQTYRPSTFEGMERIVRPHAGSILGSLCFVFAAAVALTLTGTLRKTLELFASRLNSAAVTIETASMDWWGQTLHLRGIRVAHHVRNDLDRLRIDRAEVRVDLFKLLSRKMIVEDLQVDGVSLNTRRDGINEPNLNLDPASVSVFDRVDDRLYGSLATRTSDGALSRVDFLSSALPIRDRIKRLRTQLKIFTDLQALEQQVDLALGASDGRAVASDPTWSRDLRGTIQNSLAGDVARIRRSLAVPQDEEQDLSLWLFGTRSLNYLGRISYWVDLSRRRMPKGSRLGLLSISHQGSDWGVNYHFGKNSASPAFLLKHASVASDYDPERPKKTWLRGELHGFTTDPYITTVPARFRLEAKLDPKTDHAIQLWGQVDHTGDKSLETFSLRLRDVPLQNYRLHDSVGFSLSATESTVTADVEGRFDEAQSSVEWLADFHRPTLTMRTRHRALETALAPVLEGNPPLRLRGSLEGETGDYALNEHSTFGRELGRALHSGLRHELGAVDDTIRQTLLDEVEPQRLRIAEKVQQLTASRAP